MALEILEPSLISDMARRYDRNATDTDANGISDERMRHVLGLPPRHTAHVATPRAIEPLTFAQMVERGIIRVTDKAAQCLSAGKPS